MAANINPGLSNPCLNSTFSFQMEAGINLFNVMCWNGYFSGLSVVYNEVIGNIITYLAGENKNISVCLILFMDF